MAGRAEPATIRASPSGELLKHGWMKTPYGNPVGGGNCFRYSLRSHENVQHDFNEVEGSARQISP